MDGFTGPEQGTYALALDGEPFAPWQGFAPQEAHARTAVVERTLAVGRHVLVARCEGRDAASLGYDARLDALVGEVASPR